MAKRPLAAVLLGTLVPGCGQLYAGKPLRALFFFIPSAVPAVSAAYFLRPQTAINRFWFLPLAAWFAVFVYSLIDGWRQSVRFNAAAGLSVSRSTARNIVFAVAIVCVLAADYLAVRWALKSFISPYEAVSDMMAPTICRGERVLADLRAYRNFGPARGDIVVFIRPEEPGKIYMQRITALAGEKVEIKDQALFVNGVRVREPWSLKRRYYSQGAFSRKKASVTVPQNCYFVLGDYSATSQDSRQFGCIPRESIKGKVFKRYYPYNRSGKIED